MLSGKIRSFSLERDNSASFTHSCSQIETHHQSHRLNGGLHNDVKASVPEMLKSSSLREVKRPWIMINCRGFTKLKGENFKTINVCIDKYKCHEWNITNN